MSEINTIESTEFPNTKTSLLADFKKLGLEKGMTVIVHSSLSSLGWVVGGPVAVVQALMEAVGEEGTLVMPTQTADNSDPAGWGNPPVPREWWSIIREEMPPYNPDTSTTRAMGKMVEAFRTFPGVRRSHHPMYSFAAWGKHADYVVSEQPLEEGFGPKSPLAKIYELDGFILLLGVNHDRNTSLHYAEHVIPNRTKVEKGSALVEDGNRVWKTYEEILYDSDVFQAIGKKFEERHPINKAEVGRATSKLIQQRAIVNFARDWLLKSEKN